MKIGYARVSTKDQSLDAQIEALKKAGCEKIFSEKISGKNRNRPELKKLLEHLHADDILIVTKLDRLARSLSDLLEIMSKLKEREIGFQSLGEALDLSTPAGRMQMGMFAVMAEFERELISSRTKDGQAYARSQGRHIGRKPVLNELQKNALIDMIERGNQTQKQVAEIFHVSVSTVKRIMATVGVLLALFALLASILMTGAAYQFLVPALAMALGFIIGIWRRHERFTWAVHLGLITTAYMAIYHFIALEVIIPYAQAHVRMVPLIPLGLVLLPVLLRASRQEPGTTKILGFSFGVVIIAATTLSFLLPGFTQSHPRTQNFMLQENAQKSESYWLVGGYGDEDKSFYARAGFSASKQDIMRFGITPQKRYIKQASYRHLPPPQFNLISDTIENDQRVFVADIQASNNGYGLHMRFPAESIPQTVHVNGKLAAEFGSKLRNNSIAIRGPGEHTYRVQLVYTKVSKIEFALEESISLTPEQTDGLDAHRLDIAAPGFDGDKVQVFRHLVFQ